MENKASNDLEIIDEQEEEQEQEVEYNVSDIN